MCCTFFLLNFFKKTAALPECTKSFQGGIVNIALSFVLFYFILFYFMWFKQKTILAGDIPRCKEPRCKVRYYVQVPGSPLYCEVLFHI